MARYKLIIGRAEPIEIVGFASGVPAKTDTGAYSSAVHATDIREITRPDGKKVLQCTILGDHAVVDGGILFETEDYAITRVENSFGHVEQRYVVTMKIKLAGRVIRAPFTLADRSMKIFPVLLGRTLLNRRFIVDPSIAHVDRKILKSKMNEWLVVDDREDQVQR